MNQKALFFDAGPIITLVMSRLIWILPHLKQQFGGEFYITPAVHRELIERPLTVRRFQFEALQVKKLVRDGVLRIYENIPQGKVTQLARLANSSFSIQNKTMDVIQSGEMESVVAALQEGAQALVIDERTIRLFIESPLEMEKLLEMRFQKNVIPNRQRLQEFSRQLQGIPIIRSIELVGAAFTLGLLDPYIPPEKKGREELLSAVLWATKYNGCAVTDHEVGEMEAFLLRKK